MQILVLDLYCCVFFCSEHAEAAISTFTNVLEPDHLLLASSKRVKGQDLIIHRYMQMQDLLSMSTKTVTIQLELRI